MPLRVPIALRYDQARLQQAVRAFTQRYAPQIVSRVLRRVALDIAGETSRSLNGTEAGYPVPKRIDTGRLRAAWLASASDARAQGTSVSLSQSIQVTNPVEYAPYVEFGTAKMPAGGHFQRAIRLATRKLDKVIERGVEEAWNR